MRNSFDSNSDWFTVAILVGTVAFFAGDEFGLRGGRTQERDAWQQAARPVFRSRGTYDITDHATAHDLKNYLDPHHAVVWQEHSLVGNVPTDPYKISVIVKSPEQHMRTVDHTAEDAAAASIMMNR